MSFGSLFAETVPVKENSNELESMKGISNMLKLNERVLDDHICDATLYN